MSKLAITKILNSILASAFCTRVHDSFTPCSLATLKGRAADSAGVSSPKLITKWRIGDIRRKLARMASHNPRTFVC